MTMSRANGSNTGILNGVPSSALGYNPGELTNAAQAASRTITDIMKESLGPHYRELPYGQPVQGLLAASHQPSHGEVEPGKRAHGVDKALAIAHHTQDFGIAVPTAIAGIPENDLRAKGLRVVNRVLTYPLAAGAGVAGYYHDTQTGIPSNVALVGNGIRTGLVLGAGLAGELADPVGGAIAGYAADRWLPDAPKIGHFVMDNLPKRPSEYDQ